MQHICAPINYLNFLIKLTTEGKNNILNKIMLLIYLYKVFVKVKFLI